ncbi:MAG: BatA domain-containing protein [Phycisphaerales bacterium]|nr:BatA domain-containing protein [Phycisphaerales bacterium]
MTFLNATLAAAGVATIAIPIIIHLLMHRRRKPVMWGAMRFLLDAYRRQRRRLMLEKWVLLACRCLVLALLGLALGRPLLGRLGADKSGRTLFLLIDNGLTAGLKSDADGGRTALDRHKESAKAAVAALRLAHGPGGALSEGDRVGVIALGGPADGLVTPPSADLAAIAQVIDAIEPADSRTDLAGAMQIVADTLSRAGPTDGSPHAFNADPERTFVSVFSDFREGSLELSPGGTDGAALSGVRLPAGVTVLATRPADAGSAPNVTITGVEPLRSVVVGESAVGLAAEQGAQSDLARIQLRRSGPNLPEAVTSITARIVLADDDRAALPAPAPGAGEAVGRASVRWTPGLDSAMGIVRIPRPRISSGPDSRSSASGIILVSIDNDPLAADNTWRRPIEFREVLRVGVVGPTRFAAASADKLDPASWARLSLAPLGDSSSGGIEVVDLEPASIDAARLSGLDALVLPRPDLVQDSSWVRIGLFMSSGGVVVVAPPPDLTVHLWSDAMAKGLGLPADWTLSRESRNVAGAKLSAPPPPTRADSGAAVEPDAPDLLSLVRGEMDELIRPVNLLTALPLESVGDSGRTLLKLENGPALVWAGRPPQPTARPDKRAEPGLLVYIGLAFSLDWSDLPAKPLMVPLMQETIRQGVGQARGSWASLAGSRPAAPARTVELREVVSAANTVTGTDTRVPAIFALDQAGAVTQPLRRAAAYRAVDDRGGTRALVAINPDPRGSRIAAQTVEGVGAWLNSAITTPNASAGNREARSGAVVWIPDQADPGASPAPSASPTPAEAVQRTFAGLFGSGQRGSPFDWPLLIAALAFALVEVWLARRASHADLAHPAPASTASSDAAPGRAAA